VKRKKGPTNSDFARKKVKVGRKISRKEASKYNNVVDTSIHSKSVKINQQNDDDVGGGNELKDGMMQIASSLAKYLPLTEHHNKNSRKYALTCITNAMLQFRDGWKEAKVKQSTLEKPPIFPKEFFPAIVE